VAALNAAGTDIDLVQFYANREPQQTLISEKELAELTRLLQALKPLKGCKMRPKIQYRTDI